MIEELAQISVIVTKVAKGLNQNSRGGWDTRNVLQQEIPIQFL
jgi:hypothetical protein